MKLNQKHLWFILGAALLIRLFSLGAYPLMDTTESRYGEMARIMVETGNWVTPMIDYNIPFWGKPPLFTWMSAVGIELFGVNEFAVRLPHWLAGVGVIALMAGFARKQGFNPLVTAVVLASCGMFAIASGAVMTDMALTLGMSLAMVGVYRCWQGETKWGYIGFAGLAIGLLAKGPLVIVLMGLGIFPWFVVQHGFFGAFKALWTRFPLVSGLALMFALAAPWYYIAEQASPGFLNYFLVGEHFNRFVVSGWEGDLYGSAHDEPRGKIWLFWLYSAAPWSLVLPLLLWAKRKTQLKELVKENPLFTFLFFWLISPMILFTFSGNILPAYVLPGLPAIGLMIAILVHDIQKDAAWFKMTASFLPALLIAAVFVVNLGETAEKKSDKHLLAQTNAEVMTYYVGKRPHSGQFYSQGQAKKLEEHSVLDGMESVELIGRARDVEPLIESKGLDCEVSPKSNSRRTLYKCTQDLLLTSNQ